MARMLTIPGSEGLKVGVKIVTPQVAKQMLAKSVKNRRLVATRVSRQAYAMANGKWVLAEPLLFNCDGTLIDGQHRLHAVIMAKVPIAFIVIEGFDPDVVFAKIGTGGERKLAHFLHIQGENLPETLASVIVMAARDVAGLIPSGGVGRGFMLNADDGCEFLNEHPEIRHSVNKAPGVVNRYATRSMLCFCHWKFSKLSKAMANEFLIELTAGDNEGDGDPIFLLRERLKANKRAKVKLPRAEVLALIYKAWNAYRQNEKIHNLRWRSSGPAAESFPEPI